MALRLCDFATCPGNAGARHWNQATRLGTRFIQQHRTDGRIRGCSLKEHAIVSGGPGSHMTGPYSRKPMQPALAFVKLSADPPDDCRDPLMTGIWLAIRPQHGCAMICSPPLAYTLETGKSGLIRLFRGALPAWDTRNPQLFCLAVQRRDTQDRRTRAANHLAEIPADRSAPSRAHGRSKEP